MSADRSRDGITPQDAGYGLIPNLEPPKQVVVGVRLDLQAGGPQTPKAGWRGDGHEQKEPLARGWSINNRKPLVP
jgi:hypothetical protein